MKKIISVGGPMAKSDVVAMDQYNGHKHGRAFKLVMGILLIVAITSITIVSIIRDRIVDNQQNQVSITGQGRIAYQPDIATVTFGVQIDKVSKAEDALNQLNEKIKKIVAAVAGQGISQDDIITQSYTLYPQYDYVGGVSVPSGYNANQQIAVKVRDIKNNPNKTSSVIAEASKAGVNQVIGISFDVSDLESLKQQARVLAIADAQSKAGNMSKAAKVKLGEVVGWWENYVQGPGIATQTYLGSDKGGMGGASGAVSPTVPTGSSEIVMEMNISYKLK